MQIHLPWNAWFGDEIMTLDMPETWNVDVYRMNSTPLEASQIQQRIVDPLQGPPLRHAARGKTRVAIAVDDIARPTPVHACLPYVIDELKTAGVAEDAISLFFASGAHRPPLFAEVVKKIGHELAHRLRVVYHNPFDDLADLGRTSDGVSMLINKRFVESDFRLSIGGVTPHDFAGFGGGYKTIAIGLSGIQPLYETHVARIAEFNAAVGRLEGNRFQTYVREVGQRVGIDFAVNVVMTQRRDVADLYAGEPSAVFEAACRSARQRYATPCPGGYDVAVLNAYPKDLDVTQSLMALSVAFFGNETLVREQGAVVVATSAIDGAAIHYLGSEGAIGYAPPTDACMKGRRLAVYSPNLTKHDVRAYFPPCAVSGQTWADIRQRLVAWYGQRANACVIECATMQLLREQP